MKGSISKDRSVDTQRALLFYLTCQIRAKEGDHCCSGNEFSKSRHCCTTNYGNLSRKSHSAFRNRADFESAADRDRKSGNRESRRAARQSSRAREARTIPRGGGGDIGDVSKGRRSSVPKPMSASSICRSGATTHRRRRADTGRRVIFAREPRRARQRKRQVTLANLEEHSRKPAISNSSLRSRRDGPLEPLAVSRRIVSYPFSRRRFSPSRSSPRFLLDT